jgi:hypothetical protein
MRRTKRKSITPCGAAEEWRMRSTVSSSRASSPQMSCRTIAASSPACATHGRLGLDFAAADFKRCAKVKILFLEVNAGPMFAAFDAASNRAVSCANCGSECGHGGIVPALSAPARQGRIIVSA